MRRKQEGQQAATLLLPTWRRSKLNQQVPPDSSFNPDHRNAAAFRRDRTGIVRSQRWLHWGWRQEGTLACSSLLLVPSVGAQDSGPLLPHLLTGEEEQGGEEEDGEEE